MPPLDNYQSTNDVSTPARRLAAITPSDAVALDPIPKAIYVGNGGTLVGRAVDDSTDVTFLNVAPGTILDVRFGWIKATGTLASGIIGLY